MAKPKGNLIPAKEGLEDLNKSEMALQLLVVYCMGYANKKTAKELFAYASKQVDLRHYKDEQNLNAHLEKLAFKRNTSIRIRNYICRERISSTHKFLWWVDEATFLTKKVASS